MSKFFSLIKLNSRPHQIKKGGRKIKFSSRILSIILILLIFFLSIFYLLQITQASTKGFKIKELEKKISDLKQTNEKLEFEITHLESIQNIQKLSEELGMVKAEEVEYLEPIMAGVAVK